MPTYRLYGFTLHADHALLGSELVKASGDLDVEVVALGIVGSVEDALPEASSWTLRETFYTTYRLFEGRGIASTPGAVPRLDPMQPAAVQVELLRHTYAGALLNPQQRTEEFAPVARKAADVPVQHVQRGEGLEVLRGLSETTHEDLFTSSSQAG